MFTVAPSAPNAMHFSIQKGVPRESNAAFIPVYIVKTVYVVNLSFHNIFLVTNFHNLAYQVLKGVVGVFSSFLPFSFLLISF